MDVKNGKLCFSDLRSDFLRTKFIKLRVVYLKLYIFMRASWYIRILTLYF